MRRRARTTQLDLAPPNPPPARPLVRGCGSSVCAALVCIHRLGQVVWHAQHTPRAVDAPCDGVRARRSSILCQPTRRPPARLPARPLVRECGPSVCAALTSIHRLGQVVWPAQHTPALHWRASIGLARSYGMLSTSPRGSVHRATACAHVARRRSQRHLREARQSCLPSVPAPSFCWPNSAARRPTSGVSRGGRHARSSTMTLPPQSGLIIGTE